MDFPNLKLPPRSKSIIIILMVSIIPFVLFAIFLRVYNLVRVYNLEGSPDLWNDEGPTLQFSKNLVEYGEYATRSAEGPLRSTIIITNR